MAFLPVFMSLTGGCPWVGAMMSVGHIVTTLLLVLLVHKVTCKISPVQNQFLKTFHKWCSAIFRIKGKIHEYMKSASDDHSTGK